MAHPCASTLLIDLAFSSTWGLQRSPHPTQGLARPALQFTRANPQHRVTETGQKGGPLLLALMLVCLRLQLHDERPLGAHVRDYERADLAARVEVIGMK